MEHVISILLFVIIILVLKNESDKSRAQNRGREEVMDLEYPYIVKGFSGIYNSYYSKFNYKKLEEAKSEAKDMTKEIGLDGRVRYERTEIWYQDQLIQSFTASHRINIENIDGFYVKRYNGKILKNPLINFDLSQISAYKKLTIRLTNGEVHIIEKPYYSIQDNCLRGAFITYLKENNKDQSQDYRCIPINIIDKVLNYKLLSKREWGIKL